MPVYTAILLGDLNYRVRAPPQEVLKYLAQSSMYEEEKRKKEAPTIGTKSYISEGEDGEGEGEEESATSWRSVGRTTNRISRSNHRSHLGELDEHDATATTATPTTFLSTTSSSLSDDHPPPKLLGAQVNNNLVSVDSKESKDKTPVNQPASSSSKRISGK